MASLLIHLSTLIVPQCQHPCPLVPRCQPLCLLVLSQVAVAQDMAPAITIFSPSVSVSCHLCFPQSWFSQSNPTLSSLYLVFCASPLCLMSCISHLCSALCLFPFAQSTVFFHQLVLNRSLCLVPDPFPFSLVLHLSPLSGPFPLCALLLTPPCTHSGVPSPVCLWSCALDHSLSKMPCHVLYVKFSCLLSLISFFN